MARTRTVPLPRGDRRGDGGNVEADAGSFDVWLDAVETHDLLHVVPPVYNTQTPDVLLTAAAQALASWTGASSVRLALEGHGRDVDDLDLDVTRTIGWFTSLYPVTIDAGGDGPGDALKRVKEQLRAVPDRARAATACCGTCRRTRSCARRSPRTRGRRSASTTSDSSTRPCRRRRRFVPRATPSPPRAIRAAGVRISWTSWPASKAAGSA